MAKSTTTPTSSPKKSVSKDGSVAARTKQQHDDDDSRESGKNKPKNQGIVDAAKENVQHLMTENVFLRVPILIGYIRIITALLSFYYMSFAPGKACFWYTFSTLSDAVDGLSARWLKQESRVGKLFDMLTDRCSTTCLLIVLSQFYPSFAFAFQMFVVLDICSHWLFVYDAVLHDRSSHKAVDKNSPAVLRLYYSSRPILFLLAGGTELFFILLYAMHFTKGPIFPGNIYGVAKLPVFTVLLCVCVPFLVIKVILLVVQMIDALQNIAENDVKETKQKQRKEQQTKKA